MTAIQRQIFALYQFACRSPYLSEGFASSDFKKTFETAMKLCKPEFEHSMGVTLWWSCFDSSHIQMSQHSIVTERTTATKALPLEGELAQAFLDDLTILANKKMVEDIRAEQERALAEAASRRVADLLSQALALPAEAAG